MKGEERDDAGMETLGIDHGEGGVGGSIVESDVRETEVTSDKLFGGTGQFSLLGEFQFTWLFVFLPWFFYLLIGIIYVHL
jgi:hypothetical protein